MGVGYVVSFLLLAQVLERGMTVGVAYAIWAGLGVALVAVLGRLLFDDPLTWVTGAGIVAIVGGVVLVEASTASR
jgi:small multidrug resistance pump